MIIDIKITHTIYTGLCEHCFNLFVKHEQQSP